MSNQTEDQRSALSKLIAVEIVTVMTETGTTFETLAKKLNKPVQKTKELVMGFGDEMTINQLMIIVEAMNHKISLSSVHEPMIVKIKNKRHLRLVE